LVLSQTALTEFLRRPLADSNDVKLGFSDARLDRGLERLGARWKTEPRRDQKVALYLGLKFPAFEFICDPGTGKSKVGIDLVQSRDERALVLVPFSTNVGAWLDEVAIHSDLRAVGLDYSSRAKRLAGFFEGDAAVTVITYAGFLALVCDRDQNPDPKARKRGLQFNPKLIREVGRRFGVVILDECSEIRSHDTLSFRVLRALRKYVSRFYLLSGTPFDRDPQQLWPQFYLMDRGEALGESLGLMREAFFTAKDQYWGGTKYTLKAKRADELARRVRHRSIRYEQRECFDLPEHVGGLLGERYIVRKVEWRPSTWAYYEKLLEQLKAARENPELKENSWIRMRQVASGYLPVDEDDGTQTIIRFEENPKLDALVALLSELDLDRKTIVFNWYRLSGDLVAERLKKEGVPFLRVYSKTPHKSAVIERFRDDPEPRVLLGSRSICFGVNVQSVASRIVVYESPTSTIDRAQLEKRISRLGQTERTFVWDLVTENSIEPRILRSLREGQDLFDQLMKTRDPEAILR